MIVVWEGTEKFIVRLLQVLQNKAARAGLQNKAAELVYPH